MLAFGTCKTMEPLHARFSVIASGMSGILIEYLEYPEHLERLVEYLEN